MENPRTIIVSNRLPIRLESTLDGPIWHKSEGGLATGLSSIYQDGGNIWVGWPGTASIPGEEQEKVKNELIRQNLYPVFLTEADLDKYYEGFANELLWPLFHYFPSYAKFDHSNWEVFQDVNHRFAEAVIALAGPNDTIWVNDYQLMLVPAMIRKAMPEVSIGYFQHIPFPSFEIFRQIPWRVQLLEGLLGADLIGFHTYDDVRHFLSTSTRIIGLKAESNVVFPDYRMVEVDVFPMGIDYELFRNLRREKETKEDVKKLRSVVGKNKLLISVDRLDYSKGIIERLVAFEIFLREYPQFVERVIFIQLIVPSRDRVPQYSSLKDDIDKKVGEINSEFSTLSWQPILYFYRSFAIDILSAMYQMADVALVTPIRDGMNLVSKEFVASKTNGEGVLVLSETAGASRELHEALLINPRDVQSVADAIYRGLTMPVDEQKKRMKSMQQTISQFDIYRWVNNFMNRLKETKSKQVQMRTRVITTPVLDRINDAYRKANNRLILLDYDGTLVPFNKNPDQAIPDSDLFILLNNLIADPHNEVVIISGRKKQELEQWFSHLKIDLIAEHGAWQFNSAKEAWFKAENLRSKWFRKVEPVLTQFTERTPGASVEKKSYSLAWHFRNVDKSLAEQRVYEIVSNLRAVAEQEHLQILQGDKVVEVKNVTVNKGIAAKGHLDKEIYDFILAIGDDFTDEDTFKAMPKSAITIKVGTGLSAATFFLGDFQAVRSFLQQLTSSRNTA